MAGVKVTDLTPLATADPTDVMYIVDTSSNTSKQIEVQNLVGGIPDIQSGTWNPTVTNAGSNPTVNVLAGNYSRVGGVVTCSLFLDITMDATENQAAFTLTLPIASDFQIAKNAFGIVSYNGGGVLLSEFVNWGIAADTVLDEITINIEAATIGTSFQYIYVILQYEIL